MKIGISNIRCFQNIPLVDIRPGIVVVGENSTGKTSFLSALRFVQELFQRGTNPSFNKDPYSLGSFKEIAHYRGGRAGRADEFSFYLSSPVRLPRPRAFGEESPAGVYSVLREVDSHQAISSIDLSAAVYSIDLNLSGKAEF